MYFFPLLPVDTQCYLPLFRAVADADVITALTTLGILEPTTSATATATTAAAETAPDGGGGPQGGGDLVGPAAVAAKSDAGVTGPAFRPKDTAALRAVAVQVTKAAFCFVQGLVSFGEFVCGLYSSDAGKSPSLQAGIRMHFEAICVLYFEATLARGRDFPLAACPDRIFPFPVSLALGSRSPLLRPRSA